MQSRGLPARVADALGARIVSGELAEGDSFVLRDVEAEFSVSVTVARQSILAMQAKGLVESRPKRGVVVRPREDWNLLDPDVIRWHGSTVADLISDLEQVRELIEPWAAELAAVNCQADPSLLMRCREAMADLKLAAQTGDAEAVTLADIEFHRALLSASGNSVISAISRALEPALRKRDELTIAQHNDQDSMNMEFLQLHATVIDSIEAGNPEDARLAALVLTQTSRSDSSRAVRILK